MNTIEYLKNIPIKQGNKVFLIEAMSGSEITFEELVLKAGNIASDLENRGVRKGDHIAIVMENRMEVVFIYFACLFSGIVTVPINMAFSQRDIYFILENSNSKLIFCSEKSFVILEDYIQDHKDVKKLLVCTENCSIGSDLVEHWQYDRLKMNKNFQPFDQVDEDDILTIVYTSGTTERPKGIIHSIRGIILNSLMLNDRLNIISSNRFYCTLPLSYLGGYHDVLLSPYTAGASVVLTDCFNIRTAFDFWDIAIKYNVNTLCFVPSILAVLLKLDQKNNGIDYCKKNITLSIVGTAPLPVSLRKEFEQKYKLKLLENYGLSEVVIVSTNDLHNEVIDGSAGKLLDGVELNIFDDNRNILGFGQEGEIAVKSPCQMKGYYNSKICMVEKNNVGYLFTGDIGRKDSSGRIFITGRKKDMIIRGGVNVSPQAIESVLNEHPRIECGVVVGVPHSVSGEEIAAVVKLKNINGDLESLCKKIKNDCNVHLGKMNKIRYLLPLDFLPVGSNGKVLKKELKKIVRNLLKKKK